MEWQNNLNAISLSSPLFTPKNNSSVSGSMDPKNPKWICWLLLSIDIIPSPYGVNKLEIRCSPYLPAYSVRTYIHFGCSTRWNKPGSSCLQGTLSSVCMRSYAMPCPVGCTATPLCSNINGCRDSDPSRQPICGGLVETQNRKSEILSQIKWRSLCWNSE